MFSPAKTAKPTELESYTIYRFTVVNRWLSGSASVACAGTWRNDHRTYASMWMVSAHRLRGTFYFAETFDEFNGQGAFEMRQSRFPIYFRWYAFPNFCMQISRSLAYGVHVSSNASATAEFKCPHAYSKMTSTQHSQTKILEEAEGWGLINMVDKIICSVWRDSHETMLSSCSKSGARLLPGVVWIEVSPLHQQNRSRQGQYKYDYSRLTVSNTHGHVAKWTVWPGLTHSLPSPKTTFFNHFTEKCIVSGGSENWQHNHLILSSE